MLKIEGDVTNRLHDYLTIALPVDVDYAWVSQTSDSSIYRTYDVTGWANEEDSINDDGRRAICRYDVVDLADRDAHPLDFTTFVMYDRRADLEAFLRGQQAEEETE